MIVFTYLRLGCTSFGGPLAHIGHLRQALVERRQWLSASRFLELVSLSQLLPGPTSSQLGWAIGELRGGWRGALGAFVGFTLPSALLMYVAAVAAPDLSTPLVARLVHGLLVATVAVVGVAVVRMAQPLATDVVHAAIMLASMTAMQLAGSAWMQWVVIACAAIIGAVRAVRAVHGPSDATPVVLTERALPRRTLVRTIVLLAAFSVVLVAAVVEGQWSTTATLWSMAAAFVRAGAMVFGGGHVVLPLLDQELVRSGWMTADTFLAGYGVAQLMPGPLFSVAAYYGAVIDTGWPAWVNALVALCALFLPGLLLMSAAVPWWTRATSHPVLRTAVGSINAAVMGLLAAAWFDPIAVHALRAPSDAIVAAVASLLLWRTRWSPVLVVLACAAVTAVVQ